MHRHIPDGWISTGLVGSQALLLVFCWFNRRVSGIWLLALGLGLNFLVIFANGGYMPINPDTASRLVPPGMINSFSLGSRFGAGKDILLLASNTHLVWLSDRFLPPKGFPYQFAFSLGDLFIGAGAFWLLVTQGRPFYSLFERKVKVTEQCKPKRSNPLCLS
jgi:hypothetical protein